MVALSKPTRLARPIPISRSQERFLRSTAWLTGFVGGRGAGKTKIGAITIARKARNGDPWMCISPDANVVRETTLPTCVETLQYSGQYLSHVLSPTPKVTFRTLGGGIATIVFKGAEKPDKLRGPNKAGLWFDEASIISEEAYTIGIGMCRYKRKLSPALATFTPRGFKHWTFEKFFQKIDEQEVEKYQANQIAFFGERSYLARNRTNLIHCATKDNPFSPNDYVEVIGSNYSVRLREQELEGTFLDISGLMFKRSSFKYVDEAPIDAERVRYWDKASTPGDGCYSAGVLEARARDGRIYVEHVIRGQWSANERNQIMKHTAAMDYRRYNGRVLTYIEQEGAGSGKEVVDQLITSLGEYPVYRDLSTTSAATRLVGGVKLPGDAKIRRAYPFSAQVEAGNVYIVMGEWNSDFLDETCMFPEYRFVDQVDAASAAYNKLANFANDDSTIERYTKPAVARHQFGRMVENSNEIFEDEEDLSFLRQRLPWTQ